MDIFTHHLQGSMSQYLLQSENVAATVAQEVGGEGMAAEVGM